MSQTIMSSNIARETFIVQNITEGHVCINDMKLYLEPFEVVDLTWRDPAEVRRSRGLGRAINDGTLVQISQEEADALMLAESEAARAEAFANNDRQNRANANLSRVNAGGRNVEAEVINLNKVDSKSAQDSVSAAGLANDPKSYAIAFKRARQETSAATQGQEILTATAFAQRVAEAAKVGRNLVGEMVQREANQAPLTNSVTSGATTRGRYTVATTPYNDVQAQAPQQGYMTNFNRDHYIAGQDQYAIDVHPAANDDIGLAEEIDLGSDDDGDDIGSGGGVRRR